MDRINLIEKLTEFLNEFYKNELITNINEGKKSILLDFSLIDKFDIELADYILENPDDAIEVAEEAVKQIETGLSESKIRIRLINIPETREVRIRNVRAKHIGKLIVLNGQVRRASDIRPEVSESIFQCGNCGNKIRVIQKEKTISNPSECDSCDNRRNFKLLNQKLYDARWLVIEELYEATTGERPLNIKIYLKEDLTTPKIQNLTDPGNRIKVIGVLKELPRKVKNLNSRQMDIFLEANYVESTEDNYEDLEITPENEQEILKLANDPKIYEKLISSIAPALYGLEEVKEALSLQFFSGISKTLIDGTRIRGDIHILLVGDPSTAKSATMKVISNIVSRGRYVSGKGVSAAGLTATVTKDEELLGGWVLEAGALVMCNGSMIAIDEFEKIDQQDQIALHEAMEQQTISIAKASIVATLPANTAVLAGANPKLGRFDPYLPIKEQINIPETLLTRFDLKFALRDIPNLDRDKKIADHIMNSRFFSENEIKPIISADIMKKYISYAKKNCNPKMTREAANEIRDFYLNLREKSGEDSPIAITPRQYEALIRLSEASAKIQLKQQVRKEDALRAINLMKASLRMFGLEPETGEIDIDRVEGARTTAKQRSKIRILNDVIDELEKKYGKDIPVDEILKQSRLEGLDKPEDILRKMLNEGFLFSPRQGYINKL